MLKLFLLQPNKLTCFTLESISTQVKSCQVFTLIILSVDCDPGLALNHKDLTRTEMFGKFKRASLLRGNKIL